MTEDAGSGFRPVKRTALLFPVFLPIPSAAMSAGPPELRAAIAKLVERRAARERRQYGARIPPVDPSAFKFVFGLFNLNDEGAPDAIVLFDGPEDCGSGGGTLEVNRGTMHGFRCVTGRTHARQSPGLTPPD